MAAENRLSRMYCEIIDDIMNRHYSESTMTRVANMLSSEAIMQKVMQLLQTTLNEQEFLKAIEEM